MNANCSRELMKHLVADITGRFYPNIIYEKKLLETFLEGETEVTIVSVKPGIVLEEGISEELKQKKKVEIFMTHWELENYVRKEDNKNLQKFYCNVRKKYENLEKVKIYVCKFIFPMKITWFRTKGQILLSLYRIGKHESFCFLFGKNDTMYNFVEEEIEKYREITEKDLDVNCSESEG